MHVWPLRLYFHRLSCLMLSCNSDRERVSHLIAVQVYAQLSIVQRQSKLKDCVAFWNACACEWLRLVSHTRKDLHFGGATTSVGRFFCTIANVSWVSFTTMPLVCTRFGWDERTTEAMVSCGMPCRGGVPVMCAPVQSIFSRDV